MFKCFRNSRNDVSFISLHCASSTKFDNLLQIGFSDNRFQCGYTSLPILIIIYMMLLQLTSCQIVYYYGSAYCMESLEDSCCSPFTSWLDSEHHLIHVPWVYMMITLSMVLVIRSSVTVDIQWIANQIMEQFVASMLNTYIQQG